MVRVILHAGMEKTGSSSVQAGLAAGRAALAAAGFFYPDLHPDVPGLSAMPGHWALRALWRDRMGPEEAQLIPRLDRLGSHEEALIALRAALVSALTQARAWGEGGVVLLSEELFGYAPGLVGARKLDAMMDRHGAEMTVLAYMRPDLDLFPSRVQQQVKTLGRPLSMSHMRHAPMAAGLQALFGDRFRLRVFAPAALQGGDVGQDLCAWIGEVVGRPLPALPAFPRINESIPAPGCGLLLRLGEGADPLADDLAFSAVRRATMVSAADLGAPRLTLPEGWPARILAQGSAEWNRMLALTDHPEALRQAFARAPGPEAPEITAPELRAWVASAHDPAYVAALRAWIGALGAPWGKRALGLLARL